MGVQFHSADAGEGVLEDSHASDTCNVPAPTCVVQSGHFVPDSSPHCSRREQEGFRFRRLKGGGRGQVRRPHWEFDQETRDPPNIRPGDRGSLMTTAIIETRASVLHFIRKRISLEWEDWLSACPQRHSPQGQKKHSQQQSNRKGSQSTLSSVSLAGRSHTEASAVCFSRP